MGEFGRDRFWAKSFKLLNRDSVGERVAGRPIPGEGILKLVEPEAFLAFMAFVAP